MEEEKGESKTQKKLHIFNACSGIYGIRVSDSICRGDRGGGYNAECVRNAVGACSAVSCNNTGADYKGGLQFFIYWNSGWRSVKLQF